MAEQIPFDVWAKFYDATLPSDRPDRPFFVEFCRNHDDPVLELGCGTGDIYLDLLASNIDAYGIDLSEKMLDALRRKASEQGLDTNVEQADITEFSFDIAFNTVIAPLNVVRHVSTLAEQRAVFRNVSDVLSDRGLFVFWINLPAFDELCEQRNGTTTTQRFDHEGQEYELAIRIELTDPIEQTVTYAFEYTEIETGETVAVMEFDMALVPKQQFDLLLDDSGFSDWMYYNGTELNPLTTPREPVICIAER